MTPRERFAVKCRPMRRDGCVRWRGKLDKGYGLFFLKGSQYRAHIVALFLADIIIPEGHVVHHKCRHKWCVATAHLEVLPNQAEHVRRHRKYPNRRATQRAADARRVQRRQMDPEYRAHYLARRRELYAQKREKERAA